MNLTELISIVYEHKQVFLTGAAGTGKSYVLKQLIQSNTKLLLLGTTNASALNIDGYTIHSIFGFGISKNVLELKVKDGENIKRIARKHRLSNKAAKSRFIGNIKKIIKDVDIIVIDEASMLSAELLEMIYYRLDQCKINDAKFLFVGDLYQLPPVSTSTNQQAAVYRSDYWKPKIIELTEIKRTNDKEFAAIQKEIREGIWSASGVKMIDSMCNRTVENFDPIYLVATNKKADKINLESLEKLNGKEYLYKTKVYKDVTNGKALKDLLIDDIVNLKIGSKVVLTHTLKESNTPKGLLGVVEDCNDRSVLVNFGGKIIDVPFVSFEKSRVLLDDSNPRTVIDCEGEYMPLKLAWALTIHRSQGMSLDEVEIDCAGIFIPSQFYVALSRAKNPDKCVIKNYKNTRWFNEDVKEYLKSSDIQYIDSIEC